MAGYSFQIFRDRKRTFRVRFVARNGETMFSTEGYASKASAMNAIRSILRNSPGAEVEDMVPRARPAKKRAASSVRRRAPATEQLDRGQVQEIEGALATAQHAFDRASTMLAEIGHSVDAANARLAAAQAVTDRTIEENQRTLDAMTGSRYARTG